jgi:hypothetical protein
VRALVVTALERVALRGWPATVQRPAPGGWLLRATPGLDRARSNHALPPDRELAPGEIEPALHRVRAFAAEYDIATGIQVSPLHRHARLMHALDERDWARHWPTLVLAGPSGPGWEAASAADHLHGVDHADLAWLAAWAKCEPGRDVDAHAATVFAHLRGRAALAGWVPTPSESPPPRANGWACSAWLSTPVGAGPGWAPRWSKRS